MNQSAALPENMRRGEAASASPLLQRKCACGGKSVLDGEGEHGRKKRGGTLQRSSRGSAPGEVAPMVYDVLDAPSQPLDAATRAAMEPYFGYDFSQVRIHTDEVAAASARQVNALAYTVGTDVVFDTGQFAPGSPSGRQLLAHELTHVAQQGTGRIARASHSPELTVAETGGAAEREADLMASRVAGLPAEPGNRPAAAPLRASQGAGVVQRKPAKPSKPAANVSRGAAIVEDGQKRAAGQMQRSEFLTALRETVLKDCETELAPFGRTARGCPYILRTLERYAARPVASLLKFLRVFAKPPAGADAQGLIRAATRQARTLAKRVAEKRGPRVQAMTEDPAGHLPSHDPLAIQAQLAGGSPLEGPVRAKMERSMGTEFGAVRVHTGGAAARLSDGLGARAFTVGQDIAFAAGEYRPGSQTGDTLLAHELAHTIQQRSGGSNPAGRDERAMEHQANQAAARVASGGEGAGALVSEGGSATQVQRWPVVVAGGIALAEVGTEAVVVTEVAAITTEVVVTDSALVLTAEAAPAVVETVAPAAIETLAPAAVETTVSSSAVSTTAAVAGTTIAATTLSSDSATEQEDDDSSPNDCQKANPTWPLCFESSSSSAYSEAGVFAAQRGAKITNCYPMGSAFSVDYCGTGPGVSWHCDTDDPKFTVSLFQCLCCNADGTGGEWWTGAHESPGSPKGSAQRRDPDKKYDKKKEGREKDQKKRDRRDHDDD